MNYLNQIYNLDKLNTDLESIFAKDLLTLLLKIIGLYDFDTRDHSEKVAKLAFIISREMGFSKQKAKKVYWAGLMHDIGKLFIPSKIINKKEELTAEEFELIKKHPQRGYELLNSSEILKPISKYVLYHHEKWNGTGYPEGLKANEIPLISQILGVADAWHAMISQRSYRDSLSFKQALVEIKKNKAKQFSPRVVEAFIVIIENDKI